MRAKHTKTPEVINSQQGQTIHEWEDLVPASIPMSHKQNKFEGYSIPKACQIKSKLSMYNGNCSEIILHRVSKNNSEQDNIF
jgi:hypothetical protein